MHAIAFKVPLRYNTGMLIAQPQALEGRLGGGEYAGSKSPPPSQREGPRPTRLLGPGRC